MGKLEVRLDANHALETTTGALLDMMDQESLYRLLCGCLERFNSSALRGNLATASGSELEEIRTLLETAIAVHPAIFEDLILRVEDPW